MELPSVNWLEKAADWSWTIVLLIATVLGRDHIKISRHEVRLKTLENQHVERSKKLSEIDRKIDTNQHVMLAEVAKLRDEMNANHRMVVSELLKKVPTA